MKLPIAIILLILCINIVSAEVIYENGQPVDINITTIGDLQYVNGVAMPNYNDVKNTILYSNGRQNLTMEDVRMGKKFDPLLIETQSVDIVGIISNTSSDVYDSITNTVDDIGNFIIDTVNNLIPEPESVLSDNSSIDNSTNQSVVLDNFDNQSVVIDNSTDVSNQTG